MDLSTHNDGTRNSETVSETESLVSYSILCLPVINIQGNLETKPQVIRLIHKLSILFTNIIEFILVVPLFTFGRIILDRVPRQNSTIIRVKNKGGIKAITYFVD